MDTQHLMDNENPKVFKNFEEFQKYILDLEDKHLIKLPLNKNEIVNGLDNIKQFKYEKDLSLNKKELVDFENSRICNNMESLCSFNNENCTEKILDDNTCNEVKNMIDNTDDLNERCFVKNEESEICKKYNKNRWNLELLDNFCVKTNQNYDFNKCLEGEYFKENLLDFQL